MKPKFNLPFKASFGYSKLHFIPYVEWRFSMIGLLPMMNSCHRVVILEFKHPITKVETTFSYGYN